VNKANRKAYRQCFTQIRAVLTRHDPIGIIFVYIDDIDPETGTVSSRLELANVVKGQTHIINSGEYDPEVGTILPRLEEARSVDDVQRIIHEEFIQWFGNSTGSICRYKQIAEEVWSVWQHCTLKACHTPDSIGE
jgi:hypothetical protein